MLILDTFPGEEEDMPVWARTDRMQRKTHGGVACFAPVPQAGSHRMERLGTLCVACPAQGAHMKSN